MKKSMSTIISFGLIVGIMTGCASTPTASENKAAASPTTAPSTAPSAAPTASTFESAWPRTITDDFGHTVTLKKAAEKIIPIYFGHIETLIALGVPPVAAPTAKSYVMTREVLKPMADKLNIKELGSSKDFEQMMGVSPDLIVGTANSVDDYAALNKVAPTLLFNTQTWQAVVNNYGKVLGKEKEAAKIISDLESLITKSREKLAPYKDKTSVVMSDLGNKTFGLVGSGPTSQTAWFDKTVGYGLTPPKGYPEKYSQISLEGLAALDPDYIFLDNIDGAEKDNYAPTWLMPGTADTTIWKNLKAVKTNNVFNLPPGSKSGAPLSQKLAIEKVVASIVK
ncbi:ABC transporter substrate-binding protein [Paenibacillus qinlingensis]|uniref:Iron complex transport system substrate-binding protein n=1 Tax=Paenibacillus qinlingensis TaxID=1837343 RepID=A0ABU1NYA4_9BACL|nr:ABC transporter substrate-binding protein [Paenibacillus qinlingensis]MDR6551812.1 iron complex transport system substrate-binding protein [Paenibacillus qinlingensis]